MLEIVIKRNGKEEPKDLKKLAKWQEWASDNKVNWTPIFEKVVNRLPTKAHSRDIQMAFIDELLTLKTWAGNLMAGRLYASVVMKDLYPHGTPTIKELHYYLQASTFMRDLGYTEEDYAAIEKIIDHKKDFKLAHYQIKQLVEKYCLQDRKNKIKFESPQFVDMRLAMSMAENETGQKRIDEVREFYTHFSDNKVNNPTPNYMYMGTNRSSSPSCCLYVMPDSVEGIAAAHHIAELMASGGAGLGYAIKTRSANDPIRNGELVHFGKRRYLSSHTQMAIENTAAGRNGAINTNVSIYDPDFDLMVMLQNPRTPIAVRNRNTHVTFLDNPTFAKRVARNENFIPWNDYTAPNLFAALVSGDDERFEKEYIQWESENSDRPAKSAREVYLKAANQTNQVGTVYFADLAEMNRHTPLRDPINCTNLCTEIALATHPYQSAKQLYETGYIGKGSITYSDMGEIKTKPIELGKQYTKIRHGLSRQVDGYCLLPEDIVTIDNREVEIISTDLEQQPETALCSLSGIILSNMMEASDEEYFRACMVALKSIDYTIHNTVYRLPQIGFTAKNRLNAGVGVMGLATWMARKNLHYDTRAGLSEMHRIAERHMYWLIKASIQLGKERGNAPWIDRTKWVDGWTPLQTYKRGIDKYHDAELMYDWNELSNDLIANGGGRFSMLFTIPPGESSSKKSGPPNSIYAIRQTAMKKSDQSNILDWVAPDAEELRWSYQSAWDIDTLDQIKMYGIWNKFTDQTVSCDTFRDRRQSLALSSDKLIQEYLLKKEVGMPTSYYGNSRVADDEEAEGLTNGGPMCGAEGCSL
jgi:ribonucleoside-diphosphate reductase alpha chain